MLIHISNNKNPYQQPQTVYNQVEGQWNTNDWNNPSQYNTNSYVNSQRWNSNVIGADNNYELKHTIQVKDAALEQANKRLGEMSEEKQKSVWTKINALFEGNTMYDWTKWGCKFCLCTIALGTVGEVFKLFLPPGVSFVFTQLFDIGVANTDICQKVFGLSKGSILGASVVKNWTGGALALGKNLLSRNEWGKYVLSQLNISWEGFVNGIKSIGSWISNAWNSVSTGLTSLFQSNVNPLDGQMSGIDPNTSSAATTYYAKGRFGAGTTINHASTYDNYPYTFPSINYYNPSSVKPYFHQRGEGKGDYQLWNKLNRNLNSMIGKGRRRKLSKYRRIDHHHHHHHKYKYLPRRHLYYSKRLLRKGGADLVRVGETIPQGQNLVYENPLKQL